MDGQDVYTPIQTVPMEDIDDLIFRAGGEWYASDR